MEKIHHCNHHLLKFLAGRLKFNFVDSSNQNKAWMAFQVEERKESVINAPF
jgi:hypothetical protein